MGRIVGTQSYEKIIQELYNVEDWFKQLNISFDGSRFEKYRKNIEMLSQYNKEGRIEEFIKLTDFKEVMFSLTESSEFSTIYQQLKDVDSKSLKERLKIVVQGPLMIDQEDPTKSSGQPRDFLFELNMIAHLKASGFQPFFDSYSDAHCMFESKHILLECKRPQTPNSVNENFMIAKKQLTTSLDRLNIPNSKGIIAISISKILNKGKMFIKGKNESHLNFKLNHEMQIFWDHFKHLEREVLDTRIIGIFVLLNTPALIDDIKQIIGVQEIRVASICLQKSADFHLLNSMVSALDQSGSGKTY